MSERPHPSTSDVQLRVEVPVLTQLERELDVTLQRQAQIGFDGATMKPDGVSEDGEVVVEIFAHVGRLRGAQFHKVSTDLLKLIAVRALRPSARLILAFIDQDAADSVVGWRAAVLRRYDIEKRVLPLSVEQRALVLEAQKRQRMINAPG